MGVAGIAVGGLRNDEQQLPGRPRVGGGAEEFAVYLHVPHRAEMGGAVHVEGEFGPVAKDAFAALHRHVAQGIQDGQGRLDAPIGGQGLVIVLHGELIVVVVNGHRGKIRPRGGDLIHVVIHRCHRALQLLPLHQIDLPIQGRCR